MSGIAAYKENSISTQSRGKIVVMLYDGAIKALRQAISAIDNNDFAAKGKHIMKAQAIISELDASLDMDAGGEIAKNLRSLYNFMWRHLNTASIKKDTQKIREVIKCLEDLNEGWKAISD